ncbi:MAG: hypothetical protein CVV32_12830 [Methanomicrobiales archaeon HGW-Methanomicrobiales-3]|jgi:hypothetical protein|nr:MAG: hypothetical protein CVV32_12830 [Methanomicrobiales archaeon HGW-Methanomicrobiales-3]
MSETIESVETSETIETSETVPWSADFSEVRFMQRRGAGLVEIKTFTGKKTLTNAVALFLHT